MSWYKTCSVAHLFPCHVICKVTFAKPSQLEHFQTLTWEIIQSFAVGHVSISPPKEALHTFASNGTWNACIICVGLSLRCVTTLCHVVSCARLGQMQNIWICLGQQIKFKYFATNYMRLIRCNFCWNAAFIANLFTWQSSNNEQETRLNRACLEWNKVLVRDT